MERIELSLNDASLEMEVRARLLDYHLGPDKLDRVRAAMSGAIARGLDGGGPLQMEDTFLTALTDGTEVGDYLGLDLGGTYLRIVHVRLRAGFTVAARTAHKTEIPAGVLRGTLAGLMDHIAGQLGLLLADVAPSRSLPLGFTFSFPMKQRTLNRATLVTWTKSFKIKDGVGEDPVLALELALRRAGLQDRVHVVAILNDTTGTLAAGSFLHQDCRMGVILGTGSNACYLGDVGDYPGRAHQAGGRTCIDTEWGALSDDGCLDFVRTSEDHEVDGCSNHPGSFTFEGLFSGHYLGELVRRVLIARFPEVTMTSFREPLSLLTSKLNGVVEGEAAEGARFEDKDTDVVRYVVKAVSSRGAALVAIATSCLADRISEESFSVAVDGSLYSGFVFFRTQLERYVRQFTPRKTLSLFSAKDGSGFGATLVAAITERHADTIDR